MDETETRVRDLLKSAVRPPPVVVDVATVVAQHQASRQRMLGGIFGIVLTVAVASTLVVTTQRHSQAGRTPADSRSNSSTPDGRASPSASQTTPLGTARVTQLSQLIVTAPSTWSFVGSDATSYGTVQTIGYFTNQVPIEQCQSISISAHQVEDRCGPPIGQLNAGGVLLTVTSGLNTATGVFRPNLRVDNFPAELQIVTPAAGLCPLGTTKALAVDIARNQPDRPDYRIAACLAAPTATSQAEFTTLVENVRIR